jgi:hypothetical protein
MEIQESIFQWFFKTNIAHLWLERFVLKSRREGTPSDELSPFSHLVSKTSKIFVLFLSANNSPFIYSQNRFSQASLLISTKYFQKEVLCSVWDYDKELQNYD